VYKRFNNNNKNSNYNNNLSNLKRFSLYSKRFTHGRGNLLNQHQCTASTSMMRRQPYCIRTPTTHQLTGGVEKSNQCILYMRMI